jgi:flagellar basal body-associated protein FliL
MHEQVPGSRAKLIVSLTLSLMLVAGGSIFYLLQLGRLPIWGTAADRPVFVPLETFTVNLESSPSHMQMLQAAITLKLMDKATADLVRQRLPEVRHRVLMVLSAKRAQDLLAVTGKRKLSADISEAVLKLISPPPIVLASVASVTGADTLPVQRPTGGDTAAPVEVLFTSFIVQ